MFVAVSLAVERKWTPLNGTILFAGLLNVRTATTLYTFKMQSAIPSATVFSIASLNGAKSWLRLFSCSCFLKPLVVLCAHFQSNRGAFAFWLIAGTITHIELLNSSVTTPDC